jgi:hypothetical protein
VADDNKIQFDIELNEGSVDSSFKIIDQRAVKSAKESAAVFGEAFQRQEQELKASIERIVGNTKTAATKSAKESAAAFEAAFKQQEALNKKLSKEMGDGFRDAIKRLSGGDEVKKSAKESAEAFEEAFQRSLTDADRGIWDNLIPKNINSITDIAAGFFLLQQAASAAGAAISGAINFIINGEKEIKLERRFEALATQAGVAADVIKDELKTATAGFIDETKLLELGSEAFIKLGTNAASLPQILELARKTYVAFGGDIVENADKITQAIFTGQTRQLRGLGLLVDTEKVYKEYARTLGTVPALLNEEQRQQALLNAVLEKGKTQFKNINVEANGTEEGFKRLKTATTELYDALSIKTAQQSSGFFASLANLAAKGFAALTESINKTPIEKAKERLSELEGKAKELQATIEAASGSYSNFGRGGAVQLERRKAELEAIKKQIDDLRTSEKILAEDKMKAERMLGGGATPSSAPDTSSDEYLKRKQDLTLKVLELNNQLQASEVQLAQDEFTRKQNSANLDALYYQQKLQAAEMYNQQKATLNKFYEDNGIIDETLRQQGREALEQAHLNRMLQLRMNYEAQKKTMFIEGETQAISTGQAFQGILEGMEQQAQETSVNATKNFKQMGRAMMTSIGSASANAFASFGQAIAEGDNALEAFGKSLLNSLGQMAIQMGTMFIAQGIAFMWAGLANGPPLIAAGAALATIGGVLSVIGGTGPRDASGGGGTAGGGIGYNDNNNNPVNDIMAPEDTVAQTPQTAVNLTINGNVMDRRETGLEIAKILEEQFADQGLVIRGA